MNNVIEKKETNLYHTPLRLVYIDNNGVGVYLRKHQRFGNHIFSLGLMSGISPEANIEFLRANDVYYHKTMAEISFTDFISQKSPLKREELCKLYELFECAYTLRDFLRVSISKDERSIHLTYLSDIVNLDSLADKLNLLLDEIWDMLK